jgi:F420-dependent oxidoreductase-like protein
MQIPARTPAMAAMTAATLDTLSGGRFRMGLGVSGPQVSEGWHGVRFDRPLARTREYVEIVRKALRRETLRYEGAHYTLPLPDGPGKALKLTVHPAREHIPVYLAAIGPKNLELAGEIADGWLGVFFSPEHAALSLDPVAAGRARAGATGGDFDVAVTVPLVVTAGDSEAELAAAGDLTRWYAALYLGGMGSRERNFYNQLATRMGYAAEAKRVQDLYLDRQHREAAAALPHAFLDQTALLGSAARLADRMRAFADAGVTTLNVVPFAADPAERVAALRTAAEAAGRAGVE